MYTLLRNQWWLWCSDFLLVPTVFFLSMFSLSFFIFISAQLFLYHKLVDIPRFCDIPSDISQLPFSSGRIQFSFFQDSTFRIVLLQVSRDGSACQNHKKQSNVVASNSAQIGTTRLWMEYNAGFTHSCAIQILYAVVFFRFFCSINIQ